MIEIFTTYNIIIGVSAILNIVLLIGVRNLLKQNEQLEDRVVETVDTVRTRIVKALDQMRVIDTKQTFRKNEITDGMEISVMVADDPPPPLVWSDAESDWSD